MRSLIWQRFHAPSRLYSAGVATNVPKKRSNLSITVSKQESLSEWYTQCLLKAEILDYTDISGCYILRPAGIAIWNHLQEYLKDQLHKRGVQDAYFPLLISQAALEREQAHLAGFSPEVAWVTKAGRTNLSAPLAIRPTSETAIYPAYSRWVRSWRDLPLRLNQWCSVVRWEFRNPTPLIRSREFLWQEGHSAFATAQEADCEVRDILRLYQDTYEQMLAIAVIPGIKSEGERFAGASNTLTVEAFIPEAGRAIQGATAHALGQNFSRIFDIHFETADGGQDWAWQTSWGFTTRALGAALMQHGDDQGAVVAPSVAHTQVVIIPIGHNKHDPVHGLIDDYQGPARVGETSSSGQIIAYSHDLAERLRSAGLRCVVDASEQHSTGWKFNQWELRGVPLRIEVGLREISSGQLTTVRRLDGKRGRITCQGEEFITKVREILKQIHQEMLAKSRDRLVAHQKKCSTWAELMDIVEGERSMALIPWCEQVACEMTVGDRGKKVSGDGGGKIKCLCIPLEGPEEPLSPGTKCVVCGERLARRMALFGRSF